MTPVPPLSPPPQADPAATANDSPTKLTGKPSVKLTMLAPTDPQAPPATVASPQATSTSGSNPTAPLALYVAIRRGRVTILTIVMVAALMLMVYAFNCGIELKRIKDTDKTLDQQTKLLDDYNSYSGNIASLFGTPVELFVSAAVQVILLRFMTRSITEAVPNWKLNAVSVVVGAVAAYLISNGFNALNVQLQPREIEAVISSADLSLSFNSSTSGFSTNASFSFPEMQSKNPITNTILRSAVLPRVLNPQPFCKGNKVSASPPTAVTYGFMQRDWQTQVLQEALPSKQLKVVVTPTNISLQDDATSADLPMTPLLAADLYLYGMLMMLNTFSMAWHFEIKNESLRPAPNASLAKVYGLLPHDTPTTNDDATQRDFFVNRAASSIRSQLQATPDTSSAQINVSFSHVQMSESIAFDAITIDFEIDPMVLADSSTKGNATRFTNFEYASSCGPLPGQCLLEKTLFGDNDYQYDPPAQVQAFAQCQNADGSQELRTLFYFDVFPDHLDCKELSNSSMLVFSVGKRVVVDVLSLKQATSSSEWDSNKTVLEDSTSRNLATNLRKIYTVTIGRLSWQLSNLSHAFGATCEDTDSPVSCLGLQFPLTRVSTGVVKQTLVVGAASLTVSALPPLSLDFAARNQRLFPLAVIHEPHGRYLNPEFLSAMNPGRVVGAEGTGDLLLPHNIKFRNWTATSWEANPISCDPSIEDRINSVLNNHLYSEHGLQPAYTAAFFFLFEDAVVHDVIPVDDKGTITLDFHLNIRHIAVWLSVPDQSVWFTLAGCVLLVVGLAAAMVESLVLSKAKSDSLARITAPHVIARVMLDEVQFPPLLLHRHIISSQATDMHRKVDQFAIDSLGLQHQQDHDRLAAVA